MNASCSREYLLSNAKEKEIYIERLGGLAKRTFALDRGGLFTNITPITRFFAERLWHTIIFLQPPAFLYLFFFVCVVWGVGGEGACEPVPKTPQLYVGIWTPSHSSHIYLLG